MRLLLILAKIQIICISLKKITDEKKSSKQEFIKTLCFENSQRQVFTEY